MKILELVSKKFRPLGPFLYLKCCPVAQSTKIVSRHICQAKHLDILNDQCKSVKYCLSRGYCSHTSGNLQKISDMLDALNLGQIESKDCRNIILNLLESCVDAEDRTFQNEDTCLHLLIEYKKKKLNYFQNLQKHQKLFSESKKFQKFLETLPDHLETMSVEDMVDIFGGLAMLGIPKTNFVITQLLLKILNPEVQLGLSEIAKMSAILESSLYINKRILYFKFLIPAFKSCYMNVSSYGRDDLIYLSNFIMLGRYFLSSYPEIMDLYLIIISNSLDNVDLDKDLFCLMAVLNGVIECSKHQVLLRNVYSPQLVEIYVKLMDKLLPNIDQLTHEQIFHISFKINRSLLCGLLHIRPDLFRNVKEYSKKRIKEVIISNLSVREKLDLIKAYGNYDLDPDDITVIIDLIINIVQEADEYLLLTILNLLNTCFQISKTSSSFQLFSSTKARLLHLLQAKFPHNSKGQISNSKESFFLYIKLLGAFNDTYSKQRSKFEFEMKQEMDLMVDFQPYLEEWLESGFACINHVFSDICQIAIPVLDEKISQNAIKRIENIILSTDGFSKDSLLNTKKLLKGINHINRESELAKKIEMDFKIVCSKIKLSAPEFCELIVFGMFGKRNQSSLLTSFIAKKLETMENVEPCLLSIQPQHQILTEKMANRLLKYYAEHFHSVFVSHSPDTILRNLLLSFDGLSRLPEHTDELEHLSKHIFDKHLGKEIPMSKVILLLLQLCDLGIYLDEHIKTVFSSDYLEKFYDDVTGTDHKKMALTTFARFALLNRHVVIHRSDLHIPWMPEKRIEAFLRRYNHPEKKDLPHGVVNSQPYVEKVLGGYEYYKPSVRVEYDLLVDFEYFVDSNNMPVNYEEAKKIDLTKSDIKKCAIQYGRHKWKEHLTNNINALSVFNAQRILDLRALGYHVVFIPKFEWSSLKSSSGRYRYMKTKLGIGKTQQI